MAKFSRSQYQPPYPNIPIHNLSDGDVISIHQAEYKVEKIRQASNYALDKISGQFLREALKERQVVIHTGAELFINGYQCEVLKANSGKGWQKGTFKVQVSIEFIPEEPEVENHAIPELEEIRNLQYPEPGS